MEQPRGFDEPRKETWFWKPKRSLLVYGMKQSGARPKRGDGGWGWVKRLVPDICIYVFQHSDVCLLEGLPVRNAGGRQGEL